MRSVRLLLAMVGSLGIALPLVSCATARRSVVLEPREDLLEAAQPTGKMEVFLLEDRVPARPDQAWGYLGEDSLVLFVPQGGRVYAPRSGGPDRARAPLSFRREVRLLGERGQKIGGYTTVEGRQIAFEGTVRREGDVLKFERKATGRGLQALEGPDAFMLPVSEIRSLDVWTPSVGMTALGLTVVGLVIVTGWVLTEFSRYDNSAM